MTPRQRLVEIYQVEVERHGLMPFWFYEKQNQRHGFVFERPDFFVMGRPVIRTATEAQIVDNTYDFDWRECDCWYVDAIAGDMAKAFTVLPWPLPWFCFGRWARDNLGLRFFRAEDVKRLSLLLSAPENPHGQQAIASDQPTVGAYRSAGASRH
jgi:hypothetical protein